MPLTITFDEYRALVEAAPMMIWRAGTDAKCNYFNETWLAFTGRSQEQEAGDGWAEGVHANDLDRCVAHYLDHFHRRQQFEMEYRLRRHDGVYRWIFDRGVPFEVHGEFAGYVGSCVDVQERRQADANRRTTLSMVAHELRTPLAALQTYLDVIQAKTASVIDSGAFDKVARQIQRFSRLVDDLSETARIESGQQLASSKRAMDLGEVGRRGAETYREIVPRRAVAPCFEAEIAPGPYPMFGDPDRIEQVLVNILENACKFSSTGGLITLRISHAGAAHRLAVRDRGLGIPAADLPSVTRPYFRASNTPANRYPGAGMGLAIASEIIAQHGGQLAITSQPGEGTEVTITLPGST
jgi:two-component system CheB/CheR fusion protein